ncbi:MAG: type toxin-antitoxin system HicA family toxin [Xanthobacteraceae bacterium]|jgi:hypothetical protein|nr:type toxin-antitoxin system HicA family toxin [Xanthobacteraceae bacterium]
MNRDDFIRALRKYCRKNGMRFEVETKLGKGSHYRIAVEDKKTTLPNGDYSPRGAARNYICKQLGLDPAAF